MTRQPDPAAWEHGDADVGGVRLHYVEAGDGELTLLLHGFPDFWYSWRHQIPALAGAGCRVIAPDLRGYNTSEKPEGIRAYRIEELVADVVGLVRHAGAARATLVGHDWGGIVAWYTAMLHPEAVERLVILNAPHPAVFNRELFRSTQLLRSWYVGAFQIPHLPEALFRAGDYALLERVLRGESVRADAFTDEDIRRYKEAVAQPGALTASINYYRAALRYGRPELAAERRTVEAPTLVIWGEQDPHLVVGLTEGLEEWVPRVRVARIRDAGHWVQADAPDRVNELLLDFVRNG
ncbi:alpha/beta hydrolase [soil metagenome]